MKQELPNKSAYCPVCGDLLDASTALSDKDILPKEGDFSVCSECGSILVYEEGLFLHKANADELHWARTTSPNAYFQLKLMQVYIKNTKNEKI